MRYELADHEWIAIKPMKGAGENVSCRLSQVDDVKGRGFGCAGAMKR